MLSAILSFFGGSAFRWIFGEVVAFLNKKQDHQQEMDRMRLQDELDAAAHARTMAALKLQAELGIKEVQVKADAAVATLETDAWAQAVKDVTRPTGIRWLDAWNGLIRPLLATEALLIVAAEFIRSGYVISEFLAALVSGILGLYIADRSLRKKYIR